MRKAGDISSRTSSGSVTDRVFDGPSKALAVDGVFTQDAGVGELS